ncbi:MAG: hypothetical protein FWD68_09125 [Alphaproteobacteria bacterium]|nr:hypothetical protein [Alphaproteobacteria bacterium]
MYYSWGSGSGEEVVCDAGLRNCPTCSGSRPATPRRFDLVVNYTYRHFWSVLSWVTGRRYALVCSHCHNASGGEIARPELEAMLAGKKDPIPLLTRKGWVLGLVLAVMLLPLAWYFAAEKSKDVALHVAAPEVGQIYLADLSKISDSFDSHPAYGPMKLVNIDDQGLHFAMSRFYSNKKRGVTSSSSKLKSDSYYDAGDQEVMTREQLKKLAEDGVIYEFVK